MGLKLSTKVHHYLLVWGSVKDILVFLQGRVGAFPKEGATMKWSFSLA